MGDEGVFVSVTVGSSVHPDLLLLFYCQTVDYYSLFVLLLRLNAYLPSVLRHCSGLLRLVLAAHGYYVSVSWNVPSRKPFLLSARLFIGQFDDICTGNVIVVSRNRGWLLPIVYLCAYRAGDLHSMNITIWRTPGMLVHHWLIVFPMPRYMPAQRAVTGGLITIREQETAFNNRRMPPLSSVKMLHHHADWRCC